jgi:excisionase family DNA binding protein
MAKMLTVTESAARLKKTVGRIHQLIRDGTLAAEKFGPLYMIKESDLAKVRLNKPGRPKKK